MKPATLAVMFILVGVAALHLVRLLFQVDVIVGGFFVPMWVSVVGAIVPLLLVKGVWGEHRSSAP